MVSQPACPFTYAGGEETTLLRGGDWKEEKRKEERGNTGRVKTVCKRAQSEFCS